MKPFAILLTTTALASAIAVAVVRLTYGSDGPDAPTPIVAADPEPAIATRLEAVEAALARLEQKLDAAERLGSRTAVPRVDDAVVEAAVQRYLARGQGAPTTDEFAAAAGARSADAEPFDPQKTLQELRRADLSWEDRQALWSARSKEQQDLVLAEFEQIAAANPRSADLQNELGEAYVHRLMTADFMGMMVFGQKAEKQFDRALELDDHHWGARFNKAMSLANQPAFLGRQPEAIGHFQTLIEQQEAAAPERRHVETYLFLGNLYAQSGDQDKARATWQRGLSRFPDANELRQRLGQ
jgi:tetratricopeptide (TPR) repeat protein